MSANPHVIHGVVSQVVAMPTANGWNVMLGEKAGDTNGAWFTVWGHELPHMITEPQVGDMIAVTVPQLVTLTRHTTERGLIGGSARRTRG